MNFIIAVIAVSALVAVAVAGVLANAQYFLGVVVPYAAVATFLIGVAYRLIKWSASPVPFRIPTTCGQAKGLPWVKTNPLDNPCTLGGVFIRMLLEVFLFRSLFRNTRMEYHAGPKLRYGSSKWLWLFGLLFHYSFLVVLLRHLRFFTEPVPVWVQMIEKVDTLFEMGLPLPGPTGLEMSLPLLAQSGVVLLAAVTFLLLRRVFIPQVRYITLTADWFPLLLIIFIAKTGILMRYVLKVDVVAVKNLTMSLVTFSPALPAEPISFMFFIHIFLVSALFAYFPFSKLMHFGGVWLSPTRNLVNNSREVRHINPWNPQVHFHTYSEYEDDFREQMIEAGLPVEKEA